MENKIIKNDKINKIKKALIGFIAGIISGLFSSGGGLVIVPAFIYLLKIDEKKVRGTANLIILPLVIVSSIFYYKNDFFNFDVSIKAALGGIVGGIIGTFLLKKMNIFLIKILFIFFLFFLLIRMLF